VLLLGVGIYIVMAAFSITAITLWLATTLAEAFP
jgi:hypothetical protein